MEALAPTRSSVSMSAGIRLFLARRRMKKNSKTEIEKTAAEPPAIAPLFDEEEVGIIGGSTTLVTSASAVTCVSV